MRKAAALCLMLLAVLPAMAQDAATATADAFYKELLAAPAALAVGIPDAAARARLAALLTPRLNKALADAAGAEARFKAKNKDSPPLMEGDIFSSLFEGPTQFQLGACRGDDKTQRCAISLSRQDPGKAPVRWSDTLVLANNGGWKVDDIAYDANFAFGNTGTLTQMLKMAVSEAP